MGFVKGFGKYLLVLLLIVIVGLLVIYVPARPQIDGSLLDCISLENNVFLFDALKRGMSEDDVAASLKERDLAYTSSREAHVYGQLLQDHWISLSAATRVDELGDVTVRRYYFFEKGALEAVELEADPVKKDTASYIARFESLRDALDEAFFPYTNQYGDSLAKTGSLTYEWEGADGSLLQLKGIMEADGQLLIVIRVIL